MDRSAVNAGPHNPTPPSATGPRGRGELVRPYAGWASARSRWESTLFPKVVLVSGVLVTMKIAGLVLTQPAGDALVERTRTETFAWGAMGAWLVRGLDQPGRSGAALSRSKTW